MNLLDFQPRKKASGIILKNHSNESFENYLILLVQESSKKVLFFLYFLKTFIEQFLETEFSLTFFFINIPNSDMLLSVIGKLPSEDCPQNIPPGLELQGVQGQGWEQSFGGQSSRGHFSWYCRYHSSNKKSFLADKIIHKQILFQHYHDGVIVCQCFHRVSFLL